MDCFLTGMVFAGAAWGALSLRRDPGLFSRARGAQHVLGWIFVLTGVLEGVFALREKNPARGLLAGFFLLLALSYARPYVGARLRGLYLAFGLVSLAGLVACLAHL